MAAIKELAAAIQLSASKKKKKAVNEKKKKKKKGPGGVMVESHSQSECMPMGVCELQCVWLRMGASAY